MRCYDGARDQGDQLCTAANREAETAAARPIAREKIFRHEHWLKVLGHYGDCFSCEGRASRAQRTLRLRCLSVRSGWAPALEGCNLSALRLCSGHACLTHHPARKPALCTGTKGPVPSWSSSAW